jgi:hypothetical protein
MMELPRFSIGVGDRFALQGGAQLDAVGEAARRGVEVAPVWNKSFREHSIIGTDPMSARREADEAASGRGWRGGYYVDADHINLSNVDLFIEACDFFTIDVADAIGREAAAGDLERFVQRHAKFAGELRIDGIETVHSVDRGNVERIGRTYLAAIKRAGETYRHILAGKGQADFVTEVSMDETATPQTPVELLFILSGLAEEGIPVATIAPRFSGRFNKGVDYVGDVAQFEREFCADVAVCRHAVREFGLPEGLKLSVHSGSDKFSIYPPMARCIRAMHAGLHLKTAGTTWLEEVLGLALSGGDALAVAKEIYASARSRAGELCGPYAEVIDIDEESLPSTEEVARWDGETFAAALRHDPDCASYNPSFRQLLHVGYKVAAEMGARFLEAVDGAESVVAPGVRDNIFARHIEPLFLP